MGLRIKFNLVMLAAFAAGLCLMAAFSYRIVQAGAREEVLQQARLMADAAAAVRTYTGSDLEPLLQTSNAARFLPQTIPSYSSQAVFKNVHAMYPDYAYQEAALNPTNPADKAADWQADMIAAFQSDPAKTELTTTRETPSGPTLNVARPLRISNPACLACHSTPQAAPAAMIDLYGPDHGFNWKVNDVAAAQFVTVPMKVAVDRANRVFTLMMGGFALIFALLLLVLNVVLQVIVLRPVRRLSAAATDVSLGNFDGPEAPAAGRDEIGRLGAAFNRMRRSLVDALRMLEA